MAKARDIYRRISSVENTKKITRTMEMVAASKLRRAQDRVLKARPYSERLVAVIENLITPELSEAQPLLRQPDRIRKAAVVLMTSNRGLCGAFNVNLGRRTREGLARLHEADVETELHVLGKKGVSMLRFRGYPMASTRTDIGDWPTPDDARSIVESLAIRFAERDLDAIYIVHAEFKSMMSTPPNIVQLLPVHVPEDRPNREPYYILDPSAEEILSKLLPQYLTNATYRALVEGAAAEQASRRTAMKSATDNAEDFILNLRRTYNRARQQEITSQLAEIIGGAEALAQG